MSSFFKKLFLGKETKDPVLQFGRYTDHYKPKSKNANWDLAMQLHKKKDFLNSIKAFLDYLKDDEIENVIYTEEPEKIRFKIYQGSKCISGFGNQDSFFAEAKIAKLINPELGIFRILLEENYLLQYCSFALDSEDNITLTMHSEYEDASPYKLYYGLKEMAIRADKRDDVFIEKFDNLSAIRDGAITYITEREIAMKYQFYQSSTNTALDDVINNYEKLKSYPALITYRFLSIAYTIDYLLKPEGVTMELIDKINEVGLNKKFLNPEQRNRELIKLFKKLTERTEVEIAKELYEIKSTFGSMISGNHIRLKEMVETEMKHYDWYIENGYSHYAHYIPMYIISFLLYKYAMPKPDKKLLELGLRVSFDSFFNSLGFTTLTKEKTPYKAELFRRIKEIREDEQDVYFGLDTAIESEIDYKSVNSFTASLLRILSELDIKKKVHATS